MESRHRKELKALEGEKRAAVKKAKSTKGKKAKEALAAIEEEYARKLEELQAKHREELMAATPAEQPSASTTTAEEEPSLQEELERAERERKREKARRKREKQRLQEQQLEDERQRDLNDPNSMRRQEMSILQSRLTPLGLKIDEVASDGHCLYRAVAAQAPELEDYMCVRKLCATTLNDHEEDFAPFCELSDDVSSYAEYVDRVRNSADWGGHVELRALSMALKRAILVYSAQTVEPLKLGEEYDSHEEEPIRLSYHLHYYSLGEHYNQVVQKGDDDDDDD